MSEAVAAAGGEDAPAVPATLPVGRDAGASLSLSALLAYGALGLPLAFAALPIYVHVPQLYADGLGMSLAAVGLILLGARIVDALTDPLIGWASDRLAGRRALIVAGLPLLALGMVGLLAPPQGAGALWLAALLVMVSLGYSMATISYNAWGAEVAATPLGRTRVVASREGFALVGVVLAAVLPSVLAGSGGEAGGLARLSLVFLPLLAIGGAWTLLAAPLPPQRARGHRPVLRDLAAALAYRPFARLLAVFAANGIAAAIPSATVLFFVADVLQARELAGLFLVLYFLAAALSLPLWVAISRRVGKLRGWLAGMVLAIAVFAWAGMLGSGDLWAYAVICVLSGAALGADLSLPPSILADLLARSAPAGESRAGASFGWWNFVTKANLALAAGLALPLLAALGYTPGGTDGAGTRALALVYAGVPVVLKLGAIALLWRWREALEPGVAAAVEPIYGGSK